MARSLPSLKAFHAFESAARHLSFAKAAGELNVTPAAISHHVKTLEDYFGRSLFVRGAGGLKLTEDAAEVLPDLVQGFDLIERVARRLRRGGRVESLQIAVAPTLAAKWLVPRLGHFGESHPCIDARIDARYGLPDLRAREADVAIYFGDGHVPGMRVDELFRVAVLPVCSPALLDGDPPLRAPADLAAHRLLHDDTLKIDENAPDWNTWLEAAGVTDVDVSRGVHFSHTLLALQAAADGQGVVLTFDLLAAPDLEAGRLVAPFEISIPLRSAYYLVCPEEHAETPKVAAFRDWLLAEARAERARRETGV